MLNYLKSFFVTFSDAAKFADIARNLVNHLGYGTSFTFWSTGVSFMTGTVLFRSFTVPPVMPYSIALFFKIFGINNLSVIATSFFYFILTLIFVFLLAKKIFRDNLTAVLSTLAVGFDYDLINYATTGASESPFIFEIVASTYFISVKKWWGTVLAILLLILMYFTRPQAFIYIAGLILYYLLDRLSVKKTVICFLGIMLIGLLIDRNVLWKYTGVSFLYSVTDRGSSVFTQYSPGTAVSDSLRGLTTVASLGTTPPISASVSTVPSVATASVASSSGMIASLLPTFKKVFYNLYNFFKLLPQIMSPYIFALFVIGLFIKSRSKDVRSFKIASLFMVVVTFLVVAASIPFFRYIHPVVPLIYIIAVGTLVEVIGNQFSKQKLVILVSTFLVLIFGVGQTLGVLVLDSRFEASTHNVGKPPVYVVLSQILKANTNPNQIIVTNLDTWGSWYGERKTVWFPLEPKQLIDPSTKEIPFDAIYLTSYLIDDSNYYMGADWRMIFNNPTDPKKWTCDGCQEISKEFKLKGVYPVPSANDYEKQDGKAILLIRK